MPFFIEVILPLSLPKPFTYAVNEAEYVFLKAGMRVAVPFGKNRLYTGLVLSLHENPPQLYAAKEIHQILDDFPLVTQTQLKHWQWIAEYYMCSLGEVYKSALPGGFLLESETIITSQKDFDPIAANLTDE